MANTFLILWHPFSVFATVLEVNRRYAINAHCLRTKLFNFQQSYNKGHGSLPVISTELKSTLTSKERHPLLSMVFQGHITRRQEPHEFVTHTLPSYRY